MHALFPSSRQHLLSHYQQHPVSLPSTPHRVREATLSPSPLPEHRRHALHSLMASLAQPNLYQVLGVDQSASSLELKRAYRSQCLLHHPDKSGCSLQMAEVTRAYRVLQDP